MCMMTSSILMFVDSKYLENETKIFLQIKKFIHETIKAILRPKNNLLRSQPLTM